MELTCLSFVIINVDDVTPLHQAVGQTTKRMITTELRDVIEAASCITDKRCLPSLSVNCPPVGFAGLAIDFPCSTISVCKVCMYNNYWVLNSAFIATVPCAKYLLFYFWHAIPCAKYGCIASVQLANYACIALVPCTKYACIATVRVVSLFLDFCPIDFCLHV